MKYFSFIKINFVLAYFDLAALLDWKFKKIFNFIPKLMRNWVLYTNLLVNLLDTLPLINLYVSGRFHNFEINT